LRARNDVMQQRDHAPINVEAGRGGFDDAAM